MQGFTYDDESIHYLVISVNERIIEDNSVLKMLNLLTAFKTCCWSVPVLSRAKRHHDPYRRVPPPDALTNSGRSYEPILENQPTMAFESVAATTLEWIRTNGLPQTGPRPTVRCGWPFLNFREAVINILKSRAKQYKVERVGRRAVSFDAAPWHFKRNSASNPTTGLLSIFSTPWSVPSPKPHMKGRKSFRNINFQQGIDIPGDKVLSAVAF